MSDEDIRNLGFRESLDDLPPELLKSLAISKTKQYDDKLIDIIKGFSKIATLDEIVIRLYRISEPKVVPDRAYVNNRLLSLVSRGLLVKAPKKKGVYALPDYQFSAEPTSENNTSAPIEEQVPNVENNTEKDALQ